MPSLTLAHSDFLCMKEERRGVKLYMHLKYTVFNYNGNPFSSLTAYREMVKQASHIYQQKQITNKTSKLRNMNIPLYPSQCFHQILVAPQLKYH